MMQPSSKNDGSSLCYDVIITHQNFKIDKFGDFSSDIDFKTKTDLFRDYFSLIINHCYLQAIEGSLRRTQSVRQPRSASKRINANYIRLKTITLVYISRVSTPKRIAAAMHTKFNIDYD